MHLRPCRGILALLLIIATAAAAAEGDEAATFSSLYGSKLRQVQATRDRDDDVALAGEPLEAAHTVTQQLELLALLCDHAYDLGLGHPTGYDIAASAMVLLVQHVPEQALAGYDRLEKLRQRQFVTAAAADKDASGRAWLQAQLDLARASQRADQWPEALSTYRRALPTTNKFDPSQRDAVALMIRVAEQGVRVAELRASATANPADRKANAMAAVALVVELDRPADAKSFADASGDPVLQKVVDRAATDTAALPAADCEELGNWYAQLAENASDIGKRNALSRAQRYFERYLELSAEGGLGRTRIALLKQQQDEQLAKLGGPVPSVILHAQASSVQALAPGLAPSQTSKAATPPPPIPPANGLVLHYSFDEATIENNSVLDLSGKSHQGTMIGGRIVEGRFGEAIRLDGDGDYVAVGNPPGLDITGQITLAAWIRPSKSAGICNIISRGYRKGPPGEVVLRLHETRYIVNVFDGDSHWANAPMPLSDFGRWVHLAGVYDGATWRLYRDGLEIATHDYRVGAFSFPAGWAVGAADNGTERFFRGDIDEVCIYKRALTSDEISALAQRGTREPEGERIAPGQRIDLLRLVDPIRDGVRGRWEMNGPALRGGGGENARIAIPVIPDGSYELSMQVARLDGLQTFVVVLPVAGRQVRLTLDAWRDTGVIANGLDTVAGRRVFHNPTNVQGRFLNQGRPRTVQIIVRLNADQATIETEIDRQVLFDWTGPVSQLDVVAGGRLPVPSLGIGAYNSHFEVRDMHLRMLDGRAIIKPYEPYVFEKRINPANGHTYLLLTPSTWQAAQATARKLGGHLVTINDADENDFLVSAFGHVDHLWIGLSDEGHEGQWSWVSGESMGFANWASGEPNNAAGIEHWGELYVHHRGGATGQWNDVPREFVFDDAIKHGVVELNTQLTAEQLDQAIAKIEPAPPAASVDPDTQEPVAQPARPADLPEPERPNIFDFGDE